MKQALVCFVRFPEPGKVKTRLAQDLGEERAADLYRDVAERIITELYSIEPTFDFFIFTEPSDPIQKFKSWLGDSFNFAKQEGKELGARLIHAFQTTFDGHYEKVCVIGSDCLGIDLDLINNTFAFLDQKDAVIGPSTDGGYYLIGLKAPQMLLFERIPWSSNKVLELTLERMEALNLKVEQLEPKTDIDDLESMSKVRESLPEEHYIARKIDRLVLDRLKHIDQATD